MITTVISNDPAGASWTGEKGHVDKEKIQKYLPASNEDCMIFVCGPPPMYDALCGPRTEKELSGVLKELGYTDDQVFKF